MSLSPVSVGGRLSISVLLVEDMPVTARVVGRMLLNSSHSQYHVEWRTTLAETLELLRTRDFDTVLLDLNLPDSSDLGTLAAVLEVARSVPVVVLTATDDEHIGLTAVQSGAQDYLVKGQCTGPELDRSILYSIERHRLQRTLRQLAVLDELTGLYNRRGLNTLSLDLMQQIRSGGAHGYIACFDLDHFKEINDTHGHACGDAALVEFASLLRNAFHKDALFVRLGGDEFLAMGIEARPGAAAESIAQLERLLAARNATGTAPFQLLTSSGLQIIDHTERRPLDDLLGEADARLYRDKEARRTGRPVVAPPPIPPVQSLANILAFQYPWQETIHRLGVICEMYDPELGGHQQRVAEISAEIARRLLLPPDRVELLRVAAGIHDVGKIGVPRKVLERTGPLRAKDVAAIRAHAENGYKLLLGSEWPEIRCAADVAYAHHECWDGSGYPRGLRGEAIPLFARIVAVADVYDAMRSERSYKEAWDEARVIEEMRSMRGTRFDPSILDVFLVAVT